MTIHPAALHQYLDPNENTSLLRVREESGIMWAFKSHADILTLARAEAVFGVGNGSKLRYCQLLVPVAEAERILAEVKAYRSEASQTTQKDRVGHSTVYQHHPRCFHWVTALG